MIALDLLYAYAQLIWHMIWPLAFGFALSALVRSYISSGTIIRRLGGNGFPSAILAAVFGAVSSVCNYATVGMGHALRLKGASWSNTLTYMIASTNIGITMLIAVSGFLGVIFLKVMVTATLIFIVISYFLAIWLGMPSPDVSENESTESNGDKDHWTTACIYFHDDLMMTRKDILVGLLIASSVSVLMPSSWWEMIFWRYQEYGALAWVWNAVIGIIITIITFGCSIGNVSLAAVMWWNGVPAGGIMAFLMCSLITFPMLKITYNYYGLKVTVQQTIVLFLGVLLSCVFIDYILNLSSIYLVRSNVIASHSGDGLIVTLGLNIILGVLGVCMYLKGKKEGGDMMM